MPTTETLVQSPTIGAIDNSDLLWVWDASTSTLNKVSRLNLVGATISGGGTINLNNQTIIAPTSGGTLATQDVGVTAWTPTWAFATSGSVNYTTRLGRYIVINGVAFVWGYIVVSTLASPSGAATITLPVSSISLSNYIAALTVTAAANWNTAMTLRGYVFGSDPTRLSFQTQATNAGATSLVGTDFASTCTIGFSVNYLV